MLNEMPWDLTQDAPDIGILIALPEEFRTLASAVLKDASAQQSSVHTGYDYFFIGPNGYRCIATIMSGMGPNRAVVFTERLLDFKPALVVNIGIAGGLKNGDLCIGDVIVPSEVAAYTETAKMVDGKEIPQLVRRGKNYHPSPSLVDKIPHLEFAHGAVHKRWLADGEADLNALLAGSDKAAIEELMTGEIVRAKPALSSMHLASGDFVVASKKFGDWMREANDNIHAVEMEAAGMMVALDCRLNPADSLVIRGISDHVSVEKKKVDAIGKGALRGLAMRNAWRLLCSLMNLGLLPRARSKTPPDAFQIKIPHTIRPTPRFVGRKAELKQLETAFSEKTGPVAITAVHGMPGVGKSFLAEHFAQLQKDRFPDGIFRISLNPDEQRTVEILEEIVANRLGLKTRHGLDDLLAERRILLLVENVDSDLHVNLTTRFLEPRRHLLSVIVTGRVTGIGRRLGWRQIPLGAMDTDTSLELFQEWGISARTQDEREVLQRLAQELAYLPLALALAAGYIEAGGRAQLFLDELRRSKLFLQSPELAAIAEDGERARQVIASSFAISKQLAERELGVVGVVALSMMGAVLRQEFGAELGAAIANLEAGAFDRLVQVATHLSLLETAQVSPTKPRFRFHPLMATYLESITSAQHLQAAWERLSTFFKSRMLLAKDVGVDERRKCQAEILAEWGILEDWLERMPNPLVDNLAWRCRDWGEANGPYMAWAHLHERASKLAATKIERIWAQFRWADVLRLAGEYAQSEQVARAVRDACGDDYPRQKAQAWGRVADILTKRGELDEALRIRREEQLPVFGQLKDVRERAVALGKVADILAKRGELDEALRILRQEELPVYERLGEVRERAVALTAVADILEKQGDLDEALRILRQDVLPVYERLGEVRERLVAQLSVAVMLIKRGNAEDRDEIEKLLASALQDARRLRIPEAKTIEAWIRYVGKDPNAPPFV